MSELSFLAEPLFKHSGNHQWTNLQWHDWIIKASLWENLTQHGLQTYDSFEGLMWAHCSLTPWNITELKKELKSPAGSFQHSLTAASKTQRGTNEKKPNTILLSFFFIAELQLILMRRPNMTSWKESRRNLAALAARAAEGGPSAPISFSACLSAEINILISLPTYENKSKDEWNAWTQTSMRADWRWTVFFNSVRETFLSVL